MRAVLDTSVLIADDLSMLDGELAISVASLGELHFGVLATTDGAVRAHRLRRLVDLRRRFDALPIDDKVAASYGELAAAAAAAAAGRQPRSRAMDLLIAATAHAHSARLYTRNASDLAGLGHLVDIVPV